MKVQKRYERTGEIEKAALTEAELEAATGGKGPISWDSVIRKVDKATPILF